MRLLSDTTLAEIVEVAIFRFEYKFFDNFNAVNWAEADIIWGQGVKDFDHVIAIMANYPKAVFRLDIGVAGGKDSSWSTVTSDDVLRLKQLFISKFGQVNKVSFMISEWSPKS